MRFSIDTSRPFFAFRRKNEQGVWLCTGSLRSLREVSEIPLDAPLPPGCPFHSVSLIPFSQARERGFEVHDKGETIEYLQIETAEFFDIEDVLAGLPSMPIVTSDFEFDSSAEEYEETIRRIVRDEIGCGVGANFVVARRCAAKIESFTPESALAIFRSLLVNEYGTYWTFIFGGGERFVLGATPERHLSVTGETTMMNPISGTFRKTTSVAPSEQQRFLDFLEDEKEVFELFMVTDEELKIMCEICDQGGAIVGPLLKEMSKLIHTEYLLLGKTRRGLHELLRESMYAPTVTGSPVQSAFRTIRRYEKESRSYYGATIALLGQDESGARTLDAPITIRTMEIDESGQLEIRVGATLVRNSDPKSEVKETEAKIAAVVAALSSAGQTATKYPKLLDYVDPEAVQISLQHRNLYLSRFWFEPQNVSYNGVPELWGKAITIVDAEDGFSRMLGRQVQQMGAKVSIVSYQDYVDTEDLVIFGPGPGDPSDDSSTKIATLRAAITQRLESGRPFFAECLSHQILSRALGLSTINKDVPVQGTQTVIDLFGRKERVGFYNTFCAIRGDVEGVDFSADEQSGEVHALRGPNFYSVQFHPESILSPRGYEIVQDALVSLLR